MAKICSVCQKEKEPKEFSHSKKRKDGLTTDCLQCRRVKFAAYYNVNKEEVNARVRDHKLFLKSNRKTLDTLCFDDKERQIIIGSLLGDGSITQYSRSTTPTFRERHGAKQTEYLEWKAVMLSRLCPRLRPHWATVKGKKYPGLFLSTPTIPALKEFLSFYENKTKGVPDFALKELGPLGLAVWLQDDGHLRKAQVKKYLINPYFEIHCQSFSLEDNERLRERLWELLRSSAVSVVKAQSGTGFRLILGVQATHSMAELCARYWHSSMTYKFPYPELLNRSKD